MSSLLMKMEKFKIIFPAGYQIKNFFDDNIDVNIVFENSKVFYATLFTTINIQSLINKDNDVYFWAEDMFIIRDLRMETIREAIVKAINDGYFDFIFSEIGTITSVYYKNTTFGDLIDHSCSS